MAYIRKRLGRWQSVVRVKGYPARTQSFNSKSDARLWSSNIKLELPNVTLLSTASSEMDAAQMSMRISLHNIKFGKSKLLCSSPPKLAAQFSMENVENLYGQNVDSIFDFHGKHMRSYFVKKYRLRSSIGEW
jgi:hypothetical protein